MQYSTKRHVMLAVTTSGMLMTGLGLTVAHASTSGTTDDSTGIASGNLIQIPVNVPINLCGNQIDVIGLANSLTDTGCGNDHGRPVPSHTPTGCLCPPPSPSTCPPSETGTPSATATPESPTPSGSVSVPPGTLSDTGPATPPSGSSSGGELAHTGSAALMLAPIGAAGLAGGGALLRRRRSTRGR
jgi:LPXTG-motif cell wall-anchored protein